MYIGFHYPESSNKFRDRSQFSYIKRFYWIFYARPTGVLPFHYLFIGTSTAWRANITHSHSCAWPTPCLSPFAKPISHTRSCWAPHETVFMQIKCLIDSRFIFVLENFNSLSNINLSGAGIKRKSYYSYFPHIRLRSPSTLQREEAFDAPCMEARKIESCQRETSGLTSSFDVASFVCLFCCCHQVYIFSRFFCIFLMFHFWVLMRTTSTKG